MRLITYKSRTKTLNNLWYQHQKRWITNSINKSSRIIRFRDKCQYYLTYRICCCLNCCYISKQICHCMSKIIWNLQYFLLLIFRIKSCLKWKCHLRLTSLLYCTIRLRLLKNLTTKFTNILMIRHSMNNCTTCQKLQCFKKTMINQMKLSQIMLRNSYHYKHITLLRGCRKSNYSFKIIFKQTSCCTLLSTQSSYPSYYHLTCRTIFYHWRHTYLKINTCCNHCRRI